jgi:anti-sigma-K factor RskA
MSESKDNIETNDATESRFENLAAYALDALDSDNERREVESLIDSDEAALAELNELSEAASLLAASVPPVEPPAHLKDAILRMAEEESTPSVVQFSPAPAPTAPWWQRAFQSGLAVSAAAAVLVVVAGSALGFQNNQLSNELDTLRADLRAESVVVADLQSELSTTMTDSETTVASMKSEMDHMEDEFGLTNEMVVHQEEMVSELATANNALRQALRDQSWLTYVAMKEGYQVESWLASNTQPVASEPDASGLIAVQVVGNEAVFQVHGLKQPQPGFAYTLWLMGDGDPRPVAQFGVSEIGSATIAFLLPKPLQFYSSVRVTQERVNGIGNNPTGTMVLFAETN